MIIYKSEHTMYVCVLLKLLIHHYFFAQIYILKKTECWQLSLNVNLHDHIIIKKFNYVIKN